MGSAPQWLDLREVVITAARIGGACTTNVGVTEDIGVCFVGPENPSVYVGGEQHWLTPEQWDELRAATRKYMSLKQQFGVGFEVTAAAFVATCEKVVDAFRALANELAGRQASKAEEYEAVHRELDYDAQRMFAAMTDAQRERLRVRALGSGAPRPTAPTKVARAPPQHRGARGVLDARAARLGSAQARALTFQRGHNGRKR